MDKPAWFVAALLIMMAMIVATHLLVVLNDDYFCIRYGELMIEEALKNGTITDPIYLGEDCDQLEETYAEMVRGYLAMILALLGGAAISAKVNK